jgi:uncharacterized RDD family membrane protein YckC
MTTKQQSLNPSQQDALFCVPGPNKRVCAVLIDYFIIGTANIFIQDLLPVSIFWCVNILYWVCRDMVAGQSVGKKCVGLRVIDAEAGLPTVMQTVIRNISIAIPFVAIIEYIAMRRNINGQRLGDRLAKTKVNDLSPHLKDGRYLVLSLVAVILFSLLFSLLQPGNAIASANSAMNSENSIIEGS